jgi:hypothetical protein
MIHSNKMINAGGPISSDARAREGESRNIVLKSGFPHDNSLHSFSKTHRTLSAQWLKTVTTLADEFNSKTL